MAIDSTNAVSYLGTYEQLQKTTRTPTNEMGKDQFLMMLVNQLKSQDPLSPMDNDQFTSQMTQFSMLEQMQNLSLSYLQTQANSLLGKGIYATVEVPDSEGNMILREVTGLVESAGTESGKPYVMVGGIKVPVEKIEQIYDPSILTGDSSQLLGGAATIGKYVTAEVAGENGTKETVSGMVDSFTINGGVITLKIGDREVLLTQVTSMSNEAPRE